MRLVTVRTQDGTRAARVEGDELVELPYPDVGALLREPRWEERAARADGARSAADTADLAPVVPVPPKIVCLGLNYRSHIEEMSRELPPHPTLFAKYARALTGPRDPIPLPPESTAVDWEVELTIVVGLEARRVPAERAAEAVAGFTIMNDVSMRDWQMRTIQFLQGKTWDRSTPVGPALVTLDEVPGGIAPDLRLTCEVNGETMQDARTSDLLFGPAEIVAYVSTIVTLEPGDLIATGTPAGVGAARTPPVFLEDGWVVRTAVDSLGAMENRCAREDSTAVPSSS